MHLEFDKWYARDIGGNVPLRGLSPILNEVRQFRKTSLLNNQGFKKLTRDFNTFSDEDSNIVLSMKIIDATFDSEGVPEDYNRIVGNYTFKGGQERAFEMGFEFAGRLVLYDVYWVSCPEGLKLEEVVDRQLKVHSLKDLKLDGQGRVLVPSVNKAFEIMMPKRLTLEMSN